MPPSDSAPGPARKNRSAAHLREQFFAIAAHDLQHPISNIYAAQRLLRDTAGGDPAAAELLDEIEQSLDIMQEIIHDYLNTAALQSGALELRLAAVDAGDALWEALTRHAISAQKKAIIVRIAGAEGAALADSRRLAQAVSNLLSNALKYSPPGSQITLKAATRGSRVRLSVHDQGPGVPPAERCRLFHPFGRTSVRPTAGESSTGLGLWVVRQLVALQGGRVGADFPPEGGSVFWLELPAAPAASPGAPAPAADAASCG